MSSCVARTAIGRVTPDRLPDPISIAVFVAELLDRVGVPYVIGGSFASSLHGEPRSTNDIDVVLDLRAEKIAALIDGLRDECYVDADAAREAVESGGSFNIVHIGTAVKIDAFIAGTDAFDRQRLARRQPIQIPISESEDATVFVDTAENTIIRKLERFRRGGEVSERQWRDVLGILRVASRAAR